MKNLLQCNAFIWDKRKRQEQHTCIAKGESVKLSAMAFCKRQV